MQTSFACGRGFAPTPHSPAPTENHPTERRPRRSRGRSGDQHGRLRSGGRTGWPPCEGPQPKAGDGAAARSAPRTPNATLHPPQPPRIAQRANLGPLWADFPSPPAPLSRRLCRNDPPCPWQTFRPDGAVAPARSRQAAPLPVRCSLCSQTKAFQKPDGNGPPGWCWRTSGAGLRRHPPGGYTRGRFPKAYRHQR